MGCDVSDTRSVAFQVMILRCRVVPASMSAFVPVHAIHPSIHPLQTPTPIHRWHIPGIPDDVDLFIKVRCVT